MRSDKHTAPEFIQFSEDGIEFPRALLNELFAGKVVFVCGAGVSMPILPSFKDLTEELFAECGIDQNQNDKALIREGRLEEALESLKNRHTTRGIIPIKLKEIFVKKLSKQVNLENHKTILRLARNSQNEQLIVTTNFDCLFERAYQELWHKEPAPISHSIRGNGFLPGDENFHGIFHMHGRTEDGDLTATDLVLTAYDYSEAYMRDGYATRFLSSLVTSYTVVFVGYSAGDVTMRYFLNLLSNDRKRLPWIPKTYALCNPDEREKWSLLSVVPFGTRQAKPEVHEFHWAELRNLADFMDNYQNSSKDIGSAVFTEPLETTPQYITNRIIWLATDHPDMLNSVYHHTNNQMDFSWFELIYEVQILNLDNFANIVVSYVLKEPENLVNLSTAIHWFNKINKEFVNNLNLEYLFQTENMLLKPPFDKAWKILSFCKPIENHDHYDNIFSYLDPKIGCFLNIKAAIEYLTPILVVEPVTPGDELKVAEKLCDLMKLDFRVNQKAFNVKIPGQTELAAALQENPNSLAIVEISSQALYELVELGYEAEIMSSTDASFFDIYSIPTIKEHSQNSSRINSSQFLPLISVLSFHFTKLVDLDSAKARQIAENWKSIQGLIGKRLWLFAHQFDKLFTANEAINALLELTPDKLLYHPRKEIFDILESNHFTKAEPSLVLTLEQQIFEYANQLVNNNPDIVGEEEKFRSVAAKIIDYYKILNEKGQLSSEGRNLLEKYNKIRPGNCRTVTDVDRLGTVMTVMGVKPDDADDSVILSTRKENRMSLIKQNIKNAGTYQSEKNQANVYKFFENHPRDMLAHLIEEANKFNENVDLWASYISSLCHNQTLPNEYIQQLLDEIFHFFENLENFELSHFYRHDQSLITAFDRWNKPLYEKRQWFDRLLEFCMESATKFFSDNYGNNSEQPETILNRALDSGAGMLTTMAISNFKHFKTQNSIERDDAIAIIDRLLSIEGNQALSVKIVLVHDFYFLKDNLPDQQVVKLLKLLNSDDDESRILRQIHIFTDHSSNVKYLNDIFQINIRCLTELSDSLYTEQDKVKYNRILYVGKALMILPLEKFYLKGLSEFPPNCEGELKKLIRNGHEFFRLAALRFLSSVTHQFGDDSSKTEEFWENAIIPILETYWPKDHGLQSRQAAQIMIELLIVSGSKFAPAWKLLKPFIEPTISLGTSLVDIHQPEIKLSTAIETCPDEIVEFIYTLSHGRRSPSSWLYSPWRKVIDKLVQSVPKFESDRRVQYLKISY